MTIKGIEEMPAGRDLDALIAEHVMGYQVTNLDDKPYTEWDEGGPQKLRAYSTDIAAAWRVVEKIGVFYDLSGSGANKEYCMSFYLQAEAVTAYGETAPLAICRAALQVICSIDGIRPHNIPRVKSAKRLGRL